MRSKYGQGSIRLDLGSEAVEISWNDRGLLTRIHLGKSSGRAGKTSRAPEHGTSVPERAVRLAEDLRAYFETGRPITRASRQDVDAGDWSEFQGKVYAATASIPHGETRTYGWVATRIGVPAGSRAVGQALGRNPVPLLVPCHRVVAEGSVGGFMGEKRPQSPELQLKRKLLELEKRFLDKSFMDPRLSQSS